MLTDELVRIYWAEVGDAEVEGAAREFATKLATGTLSYLTQIDERIRSRAEHWRSTRVQVNPRPLIEATINGLRVDTAARKKLLVPAPFMGPDVLIDESFSAVPPIT